MTRTAARRGSIHRYAITPIPGCWLTAGWMRLTDTGAYRLANERPGKNGRPRLAGLLRQSLFGRLVGYEDVNDAGQRRRYPAMRWVVD